MYIITEWPTKNLKCIVCGTHESVKYESRNGFAMCNRCILKHDADSHCDLCKHHINNSCALDSEGCQLDMYERFEPVSEVY